MGSAKLVHKGSTKDVFQLGENYLFQFSDRYSVFDWGEMPDHLEGKGIALADFTKKMYAILGQRGVSHHLQSVPCSSNEIVVKPFRVVRDQKIMPKEENIFVPLEVIFRMGVAKGSSLLKRFPGQYVENQMFDKPMIEFTTKLERFDRPLTHEEAKEISNLNDVEWKNLIETTEKIAMTLKETFAFGEITLWDGKVEFAAGTGFNREIVLVDSIGPDELRLTKDGVQLSKEIIRQYYKGTEWQMRLDETKRKHGEQFKDYISPPEKLNREFKSAVEEMYKLLPDLLENSTTAQLKLQKLIPKLKGKV
ncbi:MAG: phosphoribosylaminoimidazolesuccinocarboxamide synthase [Bdellovibrionota bacterium]